MSKRHIFQIRIGIIWFILAIAIGAFGAHMLQDLFLPERAHVFDTGSRYHFYGALGLFIIAMIIDRFDLSNHAFNMFLVGSLFFSFSLYGLSLYDGPLSRILGPITPIGGGLLMISLVILFVQVSKKRSQLI